MGHNFRRRQPVRRRRGLQMRALRPSLHLRWSALDPCPDSYVAAQLGHIAGDTTEAELIVMSSAANELMWLKQLCTDLSLNVYMPTLWGDNKSANLLATTPVSSDRSKHIRVTHLRVRDAVEMEKIAIDWIGTRFMPADGLTKISASRVAVCMYVCMCVCMYVCIHVYIHVR